MPGSLTRHFFIFHGKTRLHTLHKYLHCRADRFPGMMGASAMIDGDGAPNGSSFN